MVDSAALPGNLTKLREVPNHVIDGFLENLKKERETTVHIYWFLRTLMSWREKCSKINSHILAPQGDPEQGIIFYFHHPNWLYPTGSLYARNEEIALKFKEDLIIDAEKIPVLSGGRALMACIDETSYKAIEGIVDPQCLRRDCIYWLPWEEAKEINVIIPEGVEVRNLLPEHVSFIDSVWPHRGPGSPDFIEMQISLNFGLGIFRGDDLLAWAINSFYGAVGPVQTVDSEQRKGYGKAVVQAITRRLGEQKVDVFLNILDRNTSSKQFFSNLGFKFHMYSIWYTNKNGK